MDLAELLTHAVREGASDLHLASGEPPILRVQGDVKRLAHPALARAEVRALVHGIMTEAQQRIFDAKHDIDFSYELPGVARFRVNVFQQTRGEGAVMRTIPNKILTLDELGMPPILKEICKKERGLCLVTGPTGSGKSTTLAAMIDFINENEECHILTIEDPIEFVHVPKRSLVNQREVGTHTESFSTALRGALREDPDVILVGEMRDLETISLALTAAETGHLVFGTLHTSSAPKTVDRVIDVFPAAQQNQVRAMFAESLEAVLTQTLCRKKAGGRAAALEIMVGVPAVRNLIREGKIHQIASTIQTGQQAGMQTLDMALKELMTKQVITREEAAAKSSNPALFSGAAR